MEEQAWALRDMGSGLDLPPVEGGHPSRENGAMGKAHKAPMDSY